MLPREADAAQVSTKSTGYDSPSKLLCVGCRRANTGRVNVQKNFLFPSELATARRRAKLSQKALALASGMEQSQLCGVEKGRRPTPKAEAVERLTAALGQSSDPSRVTDFRWAAAHDRVLQAVAAHNLDEAIPLVSAVLRASRYLAPDEAAGLLNHINRAAESRLHLGQLARDGRVEPREEVPM